eukprot:CAMPEP_0202469324 /NCGR_PEP_ID=MMETSP1360-20130828/78148_1 /ASSEMBLY_ACC=CAM_ASM_000848 /TAXON_ID=515479 /ORGANISM="Licmophora paradoxa, Strain CCMP2313" /LENGTH=42 /DNA_ID= /DNA_START= /DNA_END= /DNA_ORIENTATION=
MVFDSEIDWSDGCNGPGVEIGKHDDAANEFNQTVDWNDVDIN